MLSGLSFGSVFVFSINSFILLGFPLTSFHLAVASLSAFLWLHTLVCAVVQKNCEISFIYNYFIFYIFSAHFASNLLAIFAQLENVNKLWNNACEQTKSNWPCVVLFHLAHKE